MTFKFFAQTPNQDQALASLDHDVCPDCGNQSFKVSRPNDVVLIECEKCSSKFVLSPVSTERLTDSKHSDISDIEELIIDGC